MNFYKLLSEAKKKKLDDVDKDELDGTHDEREDGDIDNDGDEDSSDKFLHKRRKAISKAIGKSKGDNVEEEVEEIEEGTWSTPNTPKKKAELKKLLSKPLKAKDASKKLYNLVGNDDLHDELYAFAERDPNGDVRSIVKDAMGSLGIKEDLDVTEEEAEEIEEVSKATLKRYVRAADKDLDNLDRPLQRHRRGMDDHMPAAHGKKLERDNKNRGKGVNLARKKLSKEEVEIEEAAKVCTDCGCDHNNPVPGCKCEGHEFVAKKDVAEAVEVSEATATKKPRVSKDDMDKVDQIQSSMAKEKEDQAKKMKEEASDLVAALAKHITSNPKY